MMDVTNIDIHALMARLAAKRPVFHSEADFQHALAWEIHLLMPECGIRLELPIGCDETKHVDLWMTDGTRKVVLELKYKKRGCEFNAEGGECFALKNDGAQDLGRYDFLKDVNRLEQIVKADPDSATVGFSVLLTNDWLYWNDPKKTHTIDADFRLHEGRLVNGQLAWHSKAGQGTTKGREDAIVLYGTYIVEWRGYPNALPEKYGEFRYLVFKVEPGA